jgi:hypothetical protein
VVLLSGSESDQGYMYIVCLWVREGWDLINWMIPATFCEVQAMIWISNTICRCLFRIQLEVVFHFVDIGGIVNYHCLNFIFIIF